MKTPAIALAALLVGTVTLEAPAQMRPEIRPFAGAYIPTGQQRDLFRAHSMFGGQAALEIAPFFHVLGSFGWVPGQTKYAVADREVNIFTYDVGAEVNGLVPLYGDWLLKPFAGIGLGARSYAYKADALADRSCAAGYGAIGTEFQLDRLALRAEARDYVYCFKAPVIGVKSKTRYDVGLSLGLAYHIW